jgi:hypothetical protein
VVISFHEVLTTAVGDGRGAAAADRLCVACVELFELEAAAISLVFDGASNATLGASGPRARVLDELQFTMGEGPCLDSVAARAPVMIPNLDDAAALRWPAYAPALRELDIRGVFALPVLAAGQYVGALDLFTTTGGPLAADHLTGAMIAAELAELPLLDLISADVTASAQNPDTDAWSELADLARAEVAQATGMLIAQLDLDAASALVRLRAHAYATGRSATEVARDILDRRLRLEPN